MEKEITWISISEATPEVEGYYQVKYSDGEIDEKWYRIVPARNLIGFMTFKSITHWSKDVADNSVEID